MEKAFCACGCGEQVKCTGSIFLRGHYLKIKSAQGIAIPWNKNIPRTAQEIENIKNGISPESKKQNSERMRNRWRNGEITGHPCSEEKRQSMRGKTPWNAGLTKETSESVMLISKARTGQPGHDFSDEVKTRFSERMKKDNPMFKKEVLKNHPLMTSGRYFISSGEKQLSEIFTELKIKFIHQYPIKKNKGYYIADFFLPDFNKIIEFDGHINHRKFPEHDKIRDQYIFKNYGYITLRILPQELNIRNRQALLIHLKQFINDKNKINQKIFRAN
jgi:very-short-patch-repair endonuclease